MNEPVAYEVGVRVERADMTFTTEHSLPNYPDAETLALLKAEAVTTFELLYDVGEPDEVSIWLTRMPEPEGDNIVINA